MVWEKKCSSDGDNRGLASKIGQISILLGGIWCFSWFEPFLEARAEILKNISSAFWLDLKPRKIALEISLNN